jgi:ketosteroid isomerase-like protein
MILSQYSEETMRDKITTLFILLIFLPFFAAAADLSEEFAAAVKKGAEEFTAGFQAKDVSRIGNIYAQDAIILPPNSDMIQGRDKIQAFWQTLIDSNMSAKLEIVETKAEGTFGSEVGKYQILTADGKVADQGKYLVVWKKTDGGWKLYRDMWNSSIPPASPEPK